VSVDPELREKLAALCHEMWSGWMRYQAERAIMPGVMEWSDQVRWKRQMTTAYDQLPENEKDSDRKEADRIIAILEALPVAAKAITIR